MTSIRPMNRPGRGGVRVPRRIGRERQDRRGRGIARPPGPRGAEAARTLARFASGRPLEACAGLFARYGDTVYLPVPPWQGLYIFSRPEQAEHVLAANQDNYVKPFTYRPLRMMLGNGLLTAEGTTWRRHRRIIQPVFSTRNIAAFAPHLDAGAQRALRRWNGSPAVEVASEMSALTLDVVGRVLFGADLADEIATCLVAGHETTAMALTWSLALLSAYPQARQRLEDEVDAVLCDGPADPDKLPWTTAVITEAMRLYPPAWTLERTALADDEVCGTPVPAGSMVAVLPYLVHRNPAVWPNPPGFDPGRFLSGTPERHRYAWIPFGGGKRGCIGAGFARLEAVLVLARLCRLYRLDLADTALPRPRGFVTLRPAGPVTMALTRRD
jgi:cytochrome P450